MKLKIRIYVKSISMKEINRIMVKALNRPKVGRGIQRGKDRDKNLCKLCE
jgi:hypothetical protein